MSFVEAVTSVLTNYTKFTGRARRSEYWWFFLFNVIVTIVTAIIDQILMSIVGFGFVGFIVGLALLIPGLAVSVRRLHDTDRSGWWLLVALVPLAGVIVLLVFMALEGTKGPNQYGPEM